MSLQIKLFCHSIVSDWNHGNAHFLRGIVSELASRGSDIETLEPENSWSRRNLEQQHGTDYLESFRSHYPLIRWRTYSLERDSVDDLIADADIALVHEWSEPALIQAVSNFRARNSRLRIFFHDTHHRAVTAPGELLVEQLAGFDGILVYGQTLKAAYERLGWTQNVHVWHEAADTRIFKPLKEATPTEDAVWIGNWGDEERTAELDEFLIEPIQRIGASASVYGVRYPDSAIERLDQAGITYQGWLPNYLAPNVFSNHRLTVHVPRRPYRTVLAGIPTIRPFEALACGIPLLSAPWEDTEGLFRKDQDYLSAANGNEMRKQMSDVLSDESLRDSLARNGRETILARHSCAHRVDEFLNIYRGYAPPALRDYEVTVC